TCGRLCSLDTDESRAPDQAPGCAARASNQARSGMHSPVLEGNEEHARGGRLGQPGSSDINTADGRNHTIKGRPLRDTVGAVAASDLDPVIAQSTQAGSR